MIDYTLLVNQTHPLPGDYLDNVELTEIENIDGGTYKIEVRTKEAYLALKSALDAVGVTIGVDSCFRTLETQQRIMDNYTQKYGADYARRTVAPVGTSEHHTGLALDIVPFKDGRWITKNAELVAEKEVFAIIHIFLPEHGFILRYPLGKEGITGYDYEPWHIRYVGQELAKKLTAEKITLEEYYAK